ncbi:MAG TPA: SRPBCC domain-containing protein [Candidatus Kapabacteria bacterium]|nr:SRPBCC domain-containing protein [Candidatus Kapabacteria bacterium]
MTAESVKPFAIKRTFDAPRELVWAVWTDAKHLINWFSPTGMKMGTCNMDLRVGGTFHYSLVSADGNEMWGKWTFLEIIPPEKISLITHFSDAAGGVTIHPLAPTWPLKMISTTTLIERDGKTELMIEWAPLDGTEEEIATFEAGRGGMTQGWSGTFEQLDAYLMTIK